MPEPLKDLDGTVCWNELITPDPLKSKAFYQGLFGWQARDERTGKHAYSLFKHGQSDTGGLMMADGVFADMAPQWLPYIAVKNLDKCVEKIKELGGIIDIPPAEEPEAGRFAVAKDPNGARFAIVQLENDAA